MKLKKVLYIIIITFLLLIIFMPTFSRAQDIGEIVTKGDEFVKRGNILLDESELKVTMSFMFNSLLIIGIILSVFVGGYLGIKYMVSSVEEKAEIKKTMMPFIAGCAVIFGAYSIWRIVVALFDSIT